MKKILLRTIAFFTFCFILLVGFVLNPSMAYGSATKYKNFIIHHNGELDQELTSIIDLSLDELASTKLYAPEFKTELCLNEGIYPKVVKALLGDDVFTAFSNKVVVLGAPDRRELTGSSIHSPLPFSIAHG